MEFHEKLQILRKDKGITQEELSEALFVSRTAVSKWESGRGYPSIESLKGIAGYFGVTVDELLSGEKLLSIAEKENKSNIKNMCDLLFSLTDICYFMLALLPLYPYMIEGYIYSVSLFAYTEASPFKCTIYWFAFSLLILLGFAGLWMTKTEKKRGRKLLVTVSMILGVATVLILSLTRESYATAVATLLLVTKGAFLLKDIKTGE